MTLEMLGRIVEWEAPQWLWLLVSAPVWVAPAFMGRDALVSRRRRALHAALRASMLAALAAALAHPKLHTTSAAVEVVVLADASASIDDRGLAEQDRILAEVTAMARPVRVVRFARDAEVIVRPPGAAAFPRLARVPGPAALETNLGGALATSVGLFAPGSVPRVLVLSDGNVTKGDHLRAVEHAHSRGARIFVHASTASGPAPDAAIVSLSVPPDVRPRARFPLTASIVATTAMRTRVRLERDGQRETERGVALVTGDNEVTFDTSVDGTETAAFDVSLTPADARPENDAATLLVAPRQRPRALVVEGQPFAAAAFGKALAAQDIELAPARRPLTEAKLADVDLLVLADLPRHGMDDQDARAMEAFVKDGGGLLVAAGPQAAAAAGYDGTRLDGLLPLRVDNTLQKDEPTLALALVIDRSGSMSGPKMELTKEAARGTAESMAPQDLITVVVFDSQPHTVVRLQPASNRQRILADIAQIRASGGTNLLPALREAIEPLVAIQARKKHVIVLSDGQSPAEGVMEAIEEATAARITVSAVGVGEGADLAFLQAIAARGGGRFHQTRDPSSIPRIFTRETSQLSRPARGAEAEGIRVVKKSDVVAGLDLAHAGDLLGGHTKTRAKPGAEVILSTESGAPLLARWQVGAGTSLFWASALSGTWAAPLTRHRDGPKLWAQIGRSAMRRGADRPLTVETRRDGERLVVTARASEAEPTGPTRGEIVVMTRLGRRSTPMRETSPGTFRAEIDSPHGTPLLVQATVSGPGGTAAGLLSVAGTAAPELWPARSSTRQTALATLDALAARSGGSRYTTAAALVAPGADRVPRRESLRTEAVLAAILLFLVEVALRRVTLRAFKSTGRGAAW